MKVLAGQVTSKRAELNKARGRFAFRRPVKPQPPAALSISETSSPSASVEGDQGAAAAQLEQNDTAIVREGRDSEQTAIASSSTLTPTPPISRSGFVWAGKKRARLHYRDILPVQREGAGESEGRGASDLHLTDLEHCFVDLRSSGPMKADNAKGDVSLELRAVQIRNVRSSIIFLADVRGSVMLHDCQGCIIVTRCRQVRFLLPHTSAESCLSHHFALSSVCLGSIECTTRNTAYVCSQPTQPSRSKAVGGSSSHPTPPIPLNTMVSRVSPGTLPRYRSRKCKTLITSRGLLRVPIGRRLLRSRSWVRRV